MITQISQIIIFDQIKAALGNRLLIKTPTLCIGIRYVCEFYDKCQCVLYVIYLCIFSPSYELVKFESIISGQSQKETALFPKTGKVSNMPLSKQLYWITLIS